MQEFSLVDSHYVYLDLEVSPESRICKLGIVSPESAENFGSVDLDKAYAQLVRFKDTGLSVCGHNFRRFDRPYLERQQPKLC